MATGMFSGNAAFGVFPQMQPRRRLQDPEGSANVPLDVTRGRLAGLLGLLPDALNFMGRSPMPTEMFGETQYEPTQQLPYGSDYYLENLPLKPTSRVGEVAGQAGAFVPLNPMPAARAVAAGARALGPTAVGMGERYLQRQGLMPAVVEGESAGLLGGPIKPQAPVSPIGFYSAAEQAALSLPRKSGTGDAFLNDLMKGQDVKKDELSWMGLDDYLKGKPNVTRQEVQDYIAGNRVDVQEVRLGGNEAPSQDLLNWMSARRILPPRNPEGWQELSQRLESFAQRHQAAGGDAQRTFTLSEEAGRISEGLDAGGSSAGATKYERYQLPGGENYREILLTLPNKPMDVGLAAENYYTQFLKRGGEPDWAQLNPVKQQEIVNSMPAQARNASASPDYTSSHFNQPNILAHMRVNDRIDADGKKMLLIEEVQSDWHQAGREKGYNTPQQKAAEQEKLNSILTERQNLLEEQKRLEELASPYTSQGKDAPSEIVGRWSTVSNRLQNLQTEQNRLGRTFDTGVPDAPFKGTWHQLALKRALKYAADNGYDRVGLTTGKQQVERYANEMRQNVDEIVFQTGQKLTDSQANELQLLRNKARDEGLSKLNGTERQRYDNLLNNEGDYVGKNETKIKAFKGSNSTFSGIVKDGKFIDGPAAGKTVEEVLGKSMAKQIAEQRTGTIKGDDLTIGGEGMKAYYDDIYPAFFAKQGKKYNAKTGEIKIKTGNAYAQTKGIPAEQSIRYIDISPEMRGGVKKGQPLFTAAPIGGIGLGAGTQDNEMPDAVRQYMADPRYSDPFADTTR